jgi:hypothetical protein
VANSMPHVWAAAKISFQNQVQAPRKHEERKSSQFKAFTAIEHIFVHVQHYSFQHCDEPDGVLILHTELVVWAGGIYIL